MLIIIFKLLKFKQDIFYCSYLLPIAIILGASYSIDALTIGIIGIFIAYVLKLNMENKGTITFRQFLILLGLMVLCLLCKNGAYFGIFTLIFLLPIMKSIKKDKKIDFHAVEYRLPTVPLIKRFLNGNPRQLKRFLNTLYVRQELAEVAGFTDIRPEVLTKLMVLEYNTLYNSRFEELYKLQNANGGVLPLDDVEQEAKTENGIQNPQWKDNWSSDYLRQWLSSDPSLKDINLQNYFWIARDALKNEKPIASLVTNKVMLLFRRLCTLQTNSMMKRDLPGIINACDDSEKDMIIHLINDNLRKDPKSENCWRILNCDENNLLFGDKIDRLKLLFSNIKTEDIDTKADIFFVRMLSLSNEIHNYINSLPKANPLTKAIERKIQK